MKSILILLLSCFVCLGQEYNVLLYRDAPNWEGYPGNWPAEIAPYTARPAPWLRMTREQFEQHRKTHLHEFIAWHNQWIAQKEDTRITTRDALILDALADFDLALTNWDVLTAAQQKAVLRRSVQVLRAMLRNELTQ